jgi:hypothetical protein
MLAGFGCFNRHHNDGRVSPGLFRIAGAGRPGFGITDINPMA